MIHSFSSVFSDYKLFFFECRLIEGFNVYYICTASFSFT